MYILEFHVIKSLGFLFIFIQYLFLLVFIAFSVHLMK